MGDAPHDSSPVPATLTLAEALRLPSPPPDHRFAYGAGPEQYGELRLPKSRGRCAVAILLHGGCWRAEYNLNFLSSLAAALAGAGIATWNLEYRRVGNPGGGWQGTFEDVNHGAAYLRKLAQRFELDLNRVVAVGHSAGGQLALWLSAQKRAARSAPRSSLKSVLLRGVVALAGVTDLRSARRNTSCAEMVDRLMGGEPENFPERYRMASPIELLPLNLPQRLIHGARDASVPLQMSEAYAAAARALGDQVQLAVLPGAGHFELIAPHSPAWGTVQRAIRELIEDSTSRLNQ